MRDFVVELRRQLVPEVKNLTARGISNGTQPFVLWKNRQYAANRMRYAGGAANIRTKELKLEGAASRALTSTPSSHKYRLLNPPVIESSTVDRSCLPSFNNSCRR